MRIVHAGILSFATALFAVPGWAAASPPHYSDISVLTYNVHGLPWPAAEDRKEALQKIGQRLRLMRLAGEQPHVVVLQEAFTNDAKLIGTIGGYRYVAHGPVAENMSSHAVRQAGFGGLMAILKGSFAWKAVDSGLEVLSDYPILSERSIAFPAVACAGYDCLANKGVLLTTIALPTAPHPLTLVTTHLNSRRAAGTKTELADRAYMRQLGIVDQFLQANRDPVQPMIFAGDFNNAGASRSTMLLQHAMGPWKVNGMSSIRDALLVPSQGTQPHPPLSDRASRNKDWQFYSSGTGGQIARLRLNLPFGWEKDGGMLSDHFGYSASYRIDWRPASQARG